MTIDQIVAVCLFLLTLSGVLSWFYVVASIRAMQDEFKLVHQQLESVNSRQLQTFRSLEAEMAERFDQNKQLQTQMAKFGTKLYNINLKLGIKND